MPALLCRTAFAVLTWGVPALGEDVPKGGPCQVDCWGGEFSLSEGEANCGLPVDTINGGCDSEPPVFFEIHQFIQYCGTVALNGASRDTDWYAFSATPACAYYTFEISANFPFVAGFVEMQPGFEGSGDCAHVTGLLNPAVTAPGDCDAHWIQAQLGPGEHWFYIAPQIGGVIGCGASGANQYTFVLYSGDTADCNENCISDDEEIKAGTLHDCFDYNAVQPPGGPYVAGGPNGIPDECECIADWNRDGLVNSTDVGELINSYFLDQSTGLTTHADIDCNGISNSTDVGQFINLYFAAYAGQPPTAGCSI